MSKKVSLRERARREQQRDGSSGTMLRKLETPEEAGDLTPAQITEVRTRNEVAEKLSTEVVAARESLKQLELRLMLLNSERGLYIRQLCNDNGLSAYDAFNLDLERGKIMRVATPVPMPEPVALPLADAPKDLANGDTVSAAPKEN